MERLTIERTKSPLVDRRTEDYTVLFDPTQMGETPQQIQFTRDVYHMVETKSWIEVRSRLTGRVVHTTGRFNDYFGLGTGASSIITAWNKGELGNAWQRDPTVIPSVMMEVAFVPVMLGLGEFVKPSQGHTICVYHVPAHWSCTHNVIPTPPQEACTIMIDDKETEAYTGWKASFTEFIKNDEVSHIREKKLKTS